MEIELRLREIARRQYAMVSRAQAREVGASWEGLRSRLRSGTWTLVTPSVVRLTGAPPHRRERLMAATLDGGPGTLVNRRSAADLWELPGYRSGLVQVTRQRGASRQVPDWVELTTLRLDPTSHATSVHGIPVVSLPFLLFQLAGTENPARVERTLNLVIGRSPGVLVRLHELLPELAARGRNGVGFMRDWLDRHPPGSTVVASGLEGRFERILEERGQKPLRRQVDLGGHEWIGRVDFVDAELGAIFEVDSLAHHSSELDRALDAARDEQLRVAGFRAIERIAEEWIWYDPDRAAAVVRDTRRRLRADNPRSGSTTPPPKAASD